MKLQKFHLGTKDTSRSESSLRMVLWMKQREGSYKGGAPVAESRSGCPLHFNKWDDTEVYGGLW